MKLTRKEQIEVSKVYDIWLHSYLNGDVKTYDSYFDDRYRFIGSTDNEDFLNRIDTTTFFEKTADQLAGNVEIRNSRRTFEKFDELIFITDLFDAYFLHGNDWEYYGKFRFTSSLKKNNEGWRFIYQHFSTPDTKAQEGETIGTEQIAVENLMLREAVQRRTIELEQKSRELEIEAALERVRARTMAMQHSDELAEASFLLDSQVRALGIKTRGCAFNIYGENESTEWFSSEMGTMPIYKTPREGIFLRYYEEGQKGKSMYINTFSGEACAAHYDYLCTLPVMGEALKEFKENGGSFPDQQIDHATYFKYGYLLFITLDPEPDAHDIFKRFAKGFEQTYTRFLDLQKAEAQAREAQIEAALERVRSQSLAMHKPDELQEVVTILVERLQELGVILDAGGVIICTYFKDSKDVMHWIASPDYSYSGNYLLPYFDHPIFNDSWNLKESGIDFSSKEYSKDVKDSFFEYAFEYSDYKNFPDDFKSWFLAQEKHSLSFAWSKNSAILIPSSTGILPTESDKEILKRFARVFEQAYIRFMDLQKAEMQIREAVKQASLDRVRGEIASMRTKDDLDRITPLIWKELIALDVPFIRCGVFIMDEKNRKIHTFLSTPNGESIAAFHLPYDTPGNFADIVSYWKQQKNYIHHWGITEFTNLADVLIQNGSIATREQYLDSMPPEGIHLNFIPFLQGMLYVGNVTPLNNEDLKLLQTLASAFSTAYARYEDFTRLELAKEKIEHTLSELKSTQSQLIQAEKMASLGSLTAGIAHEIQNPLNFVNNFAEVSIDLIDEMKEELSNENKEEVLEIAGDLEENLGKINHHGNRASSIVKGMLQHSRSSSKEKELTDINSLADEYLRLSYHGLRAKDKSFNADFKLEADENLPQLNVVAQDISRVLLNLINNAFYAVDKKAKENVEDYKPTVIVRTSSYIPPAGGERGACITVSDNGSGIPPEIKDKIFQPFFTTKPTGSGTGLGLSLSYDIVKAHGGELQVETKEGMGSEFIILLINS